MAPPDRTPALDNATIADRLARVADLLEEQGANQYRVQAWRGGASTIRRLSRPVAALLHAEGLPGLMALPGIGDALARAIRELVETGRLATLERLEGQADPVARLASVAGLGPTLAQRVHDELGIESLEELEAAAHDGRLAALSGFGPKRVAAVRDTLAARLRTRRRLEGGAAERADARYDVDIPPVAELLDVDREYRERAAAGTLPRIAPRRFNPSHERWLPVLHTTLGDRHYTALYSNTARAHQLGRTRDWVVLYFDGREGERQCTVVTGTRGALEGLRVVRGRERECEAHYGLVDEGRL
jgi:hypothetical protein